MPKKVASKVSPLGVHIQETSVAVVLFEDRNGSPYFSGAKEIPFGDDPNKTLQQKQIDALKQAVEELAPEATTCIIGLNSTQVNVQVFNVGSRENKAEIRMEASLRADEMEQIADEDRVIAVDKLPGTTDGIINRMLSVGKIADINPLIEVCTGAGLKVIGVDTPMAAWQRTMGDREKDKPDGALLDLSGKRITLYIFADPLGEYKLLAPALPPEKLASAIRGHLTTARMSQLSDVRRILIAGTLGDVTAQDPYGDNMQTLLNGLRGDKGLEVSYVTYGKNENPEWAFAAALAGWSFGGTNVIRANLLPPEKNKKTFLGVKVEKIDFIRAGLTFAAVALLSLGIQFTYDAQANNKQSELDDINNHLAAMATQTNTLGQLSADVHRLQEIQRDSDWLKASGQTAALRLALLGNAVPPGAWVEHITHDKTGWVISGGVNDLKTLPIVARDFNKVSPGLITSFSNIDTQKNINYKMSIVEPQATPKPIPIPDAVASPDPGATK